MPALGMAQETGKIVRWFKAEGDTVIKAEPLMEVETDKVTVEIEAPASGTLAAVSAGEGEEVPVGRVVAYVLGDGERAPKREAGAEPVRPDARPAQVGVSLGDAGQPDHLRGRQLASPKARRLAVERGILLDEIKGSGPYGAIVAADVEEALLARDSSPPPATARPEDSVELSSAWQTMARRMASNWHEVPHFYLSREVNATRLNSWRDAARKRAGHEQVTHTDLLVKIVATALTEHPRVNASWQDNAVSLSSRVNIGIAVATEDALVVPVIHDADRLSLREIAERRADLVRRARSRELRLDELQDGTFTISNLGMLGVDAFAAIVNAPQAAILAVGRIADRVIAVNGAPVVRPQFIVTLSVDHRAVDGAIGARFLDTLVSFAEEPVATLR